MPYASDDRNKITPYAFGNELEWLREKAKDFNNAVMIGAGPGVMALALMEGNPTLNLTVVDIGTCYYTQSHLEGAGFYSVNYVVDDSAEFGKDYAGPELDFLLVDGDHTKEGVLKDVKAWFKHVKIGGLIFFHDYEVINDDETNGVKEALTELVSSGILKGIEINKPGISVAYEKTDTCKH